VYVTQADKREHEIQIVSQMIDLYYKKHGTSQEGKELKDYAALRVNKCPFIETKTFCSQCKVHCYTPVMREKIRCVMRYAGPRMLFYHPILTIKHGYYSLCDKIKAH
jgi:hypothetical protein